MKKKLYIIRKYVWARTAQDAIGMDKKAPVEDVWVDDDWKKDNENKKAFIGFKKK